jgi:hypothetical protein
MKIIYYAIFANVSWLMLMQIFRFSTYHKYFYYAIFVIFGFAILNGYFLCYFDLNSFIIWHLLIFVVLFYNNYKHQKKQANFVLEHLSDKENEKSKESFDFELSIKRTLKYHLLSTLTYLIVFAVSYFYFFNKLK